ncbi:Flp pilus assembly protein, protease CpaA [Comamonas testosteroni TK102]|uniref:Flp pilus assembly protein, protease CpaA n=1 Tax=Comamonas testosteroni TK102 TaxID=1392005 RepID=A0A076PXE0_COMTE|nr:MULTISPECIES: A24 family peptidase [Comamonas]AIJ49391.1 Flp pilus assembly protein, protease CpaA [Comamonas testosteroni TK102]MPS87834.1 prepilin peptidase [Comamonas sp.]
MGFIFLLWISSSAAVDVVYRKCFNWLVISGFGLAILSAALNLEIFSFEVSVNSKFIGFCLALAVFLIFYVCGVMGAGDVKFAAVLGAFLGWEPLLLVWALSCIFAVVIGLISRSKLMYYLSPLMKEESVDLYKKRFIPYVACLSIATVVVLMLSK